MPRWTEEARTQQALRIREQKPWQHTTGPKGAMAKRRVSRNALKHGARSRAMGDINRMLRRQRQEMQVLREHIRVRRAARLAEMREFYQGLAQGAESARGKSALGAYTSRPDSSQRNENMHKPYMIACLAVLLNFSAPAFAQAPGGGAPGSSGYPGGGAPGASASSAASSGAASSSGASASADGGLGIAAGEPNGAQGGPPPELSGEKLAEIKTKILARMDENIAEIQKRKACVQAAADGPALKACMPPRRGQGGQGGGPEGSQRDK